MNTARGSVSRTAGSGPGSGPWRRPWPFTLEAERWQDSRWLFPVTLALTVVGLFCDCVGPHTVFAYRDAAHFYPPLYELVKNEWLSGRVPLWNPLLNAGQPLAGMATAGVFYPPQILLTLMMPAPMAVNVYGIGHLAVAAAGGYVLGRQQRLSRLAATAAGLAYGFSGSVLFQVYNPIYAAGAAWLVWAIVAGWWLLDGGGLRALVALGMSLALAVLAGDPQSAYHAGLVLAGAALMARRARWTNLVWLLAAAVLGGVMALVQIALASEFMRETTRSLDIVPQSVWQLPAFFVREDRLAAGVHWYDTFIGRAPPGSAHYQDTYDFSLPPWRLVEAIWPGFAGRLWSRWTIATRLEHPSVWVASIYAGLLVAALAAMAVFQRRRPVPQRFWLVLAGLSLLAAFGGHAGIGLARNAILAVTGRWRELGFQYGDEVGSASWWMTTFLPGYSGFRYPAKWLTVFALAMGQVAGYGIDRLDRPAFRRRTAAVTGSLGMAIAVAMLVGVAMLAGIFGAAVVSAEWPYSAALTNGLAGGLQAVTVAAGLWACLRDRRLPKILLLAILLVDLVAAGRLDLAVGDHRRLVEGGGYLHGLARDRLPHLEAASPQMRVAAFDSEISPRSSDLLLGYYGTTQQGHVPWLFGCGKIGEQSTAMPADAEMLRMPRIENDSAVQPRRVYDLAGVELFVITNADEVLAATQAVAADWSLTQRQGQFEGAAPRGDPLPGKAYPLPGVADDAPMVYVLRNESALPRVRIVRNAVFVPEASRADRDRLNDLLERIAFPNPLLPDLVHHVVIEGKPADVTAPRAPPASGRSPPADGCRITIDEPQRVVVEADLAAPGFVVLADTFHHDWTLRLTTADGGVEHPRIFRANRLHRACWLPAGRHRLEYRHRSATFGRTAWVSLVGWAAALVGIICRPTRAVSGRRRV